MPTASSTFIYIGNFADLDPDEANFSNENPSAIYQTFDYTQMLVTTVVQDDVAGDGQVQENDNGQIADTFTYDVGDGTVTSGLDNAGRYSVDYIDENGNPQSTTVSGYQTVNGDVFLKFPNGIQVSSVTINGIVGDDYTGITHGTSSSASVVCFAPGTLIDTPHGARMIETLRAGDLVQTLDHGPQAILWMHSGDHPLEAVETDDKPVLIKAGALGFGRPSQDLTVSAQHRMIVGGGGQLNACFPYEAFAPAKALTGLRGVRHMRGKQKITWIHFACANHEVVFANGCLSEALLLGPMVLKGLTDLKRRLLVDMYGPAETADAALNGPAGRPCLSVGEVRARIAEGLRGAGAKPTPIKPKRDQSPKPHSLHIVSNREVA